MDKAANSALSKCRNLSELEKSEIGLLQSRIEEQSHLIMILKSRADDEYHRRKSFEKIVDEMQFNSSDHEERLASESRKMSMLEEKFDILASNHEEMIKIKDDYKRETEFLRLENERLKDENEGMSGRIASEKESALRLLKMTLAKIQNDLQASQERNAKMEKLIEKDREEREMEKASSERQIESLNDALDGSLKEVRDLSGQIEKIQTIHEEAMRGLQAEKDKYMKMAHDRGQLIEQKCTDYRNVCEKLSETEKLLKEARDRFEKEAMLINKDMIIAKLRNEAESAENKLEQYKKEYDAFVENRNDRLRREIELNKHLKSLLNA